MTFHLILTLEHVKKGVHVTIPFVFAQRQIGLSSRVL